MPMICQVNFSYKAYTCDLHGKITYTTPIMDVYQELMYYVGAYQNAQILSYRVSRG